MPRPQLKSIPGSKGALPSLPFALLIVGIMVSGMIGMLLLNTYVQEQALALRKSQQAASQLGFRTSNLQAQVNAASAPGEIAARASALGMVPNPYPNFIDIRTSTVLGKGKAVTGSEIPELRVQPSAPVLTAQATTPVASYVQAWFELTPTVPAPKRG